MTQNCRLSVVSEQCCAESCTVLELMGFEKKELEEVRHFKNQLEYIRYDEENSFYLVLYCLYVVLTAPPIYEASSISFLWLYL